MNPELSAKYRTAERLRKRQYRNKNKKSTETATEASVVQSSSRHAAGRKVRRATLRSKNRQIEQLGKIVKAKNMQIKNLEKKSFATEAPAQYQLRRTLNQKVLTQTTG